MHVVIVGNGVAGSTVARHVRKYSENRITMISDESKHFYSRTALMYIYMGHMTFEDTKPYEDWFWDKNRIDLIQSRVTGIDRKKQLLCLQNGQTIEYDKLVLATGSKSNKFGWPGQDLGGVQGLYHLQDLQIMENNTKNITHAVVVGGGLIGIEMVEMLQSRGISVTMLVREKRFWNSVLPNEDADFIGKHIVKHGVDVRYETELVKIKGNDNGRVTSITCSSGETIDCQFVGLTVGVHPNTDLAELAGLHVENGVVVNKYLQSSDENVFAAGDCVQLQTPPKGRRPIEAVWYAGKMMGETVAANICGQEASYTPGVWFNSAKFFDIEYQAYGAVSSQLGEEEDGFFWKDDQDEVCVHFRFEKESRCFTGVNLFGIRGRHQVFEHWINQGVRIEEVIENLRAANFDPEFYKSYEPRILELFNKKYSTTLGLKSGKGLLTAFFRKLEGVRL